MPLYDVDRRSSVLPRWYATTVLPKTEVPTGLSNSK